MNEAEVSCHTAGQNPAHHFAGVSKTIPMPKGAEKAIADYMRTHAPFDKRLLFCDNPSVGSFHIRFVTETTQNKLVLMILERM